MTFWRILEPEKKGNVFWLDPDFDSGEYPDAVKCPINPDHNRNNITYVSQQFYEDEDAKVKRGFDIYKGFVDLLAHKRVFEAFQNAGLTGWAFNQAHLRYLNGDQSDDFGQLWATGFGGIAPEAVGNKILWHCRGCGMSEYAGNLRFGELEPHLKWDGSDFFVTWPVTGRMFCTDRAKKVLMQFNSDVRFRPMSKEPVSNAYGDGLLFPSFSPTGRAEIEAYLKAAPEYRLGMDRTV